MSYQVPFPWHLIVLLLLRVLELILCGCFLSGFLGWYLVRAGASGGVVESDAPSSLMITVR